MQRLGRIIAMGLTRGSLCGLLAAGTALAQLPEPALPGGADSTWPDNFALAQTQPLITAGQAALEANDWEGSEQFALEVMQVAKVNHGLASAYQFPGLDILIQSLTAQGRLTTVNQYLNYFEWLNNEVLRTSLEAYLEGARILSDLYLNLAAAEGAANNARYLIAAKNLNWRAITAMEFYRGENDPTLVPWLYTIALAHYYQSSLTERRGMTSYTYKTDNDEIVAGWSLSKNESVEKSYQIGREVLQRIEAIQSAQGANTLAVAMSHIYLGDWELMFNERDLAVTRYERAMSLLAESGYEPEQVAAVFSQPVILPAPEFRSTPSSQAAPAPLSFTAWSNRFPGAPDPLQHPMSTTEPLAEVRSRVSLRTEPLSREDPSSLQLVRVDRVRILGATPDDDFIKAQGMLQIQNLILRPQLGAAGSSAGEFMLTYRYRMQESANMVSRF